MKPETPTPLAIIGVGCLFPKADGPKSYWSNIKERVDGITEVPPSHWSLSEYYDQDPKSPDRTYGRRGGFLSPVDFDPTEFGITPNNIPATDPAQLLGLVVAQAAMRDAGYGGERAFDRRKVSVILGVTGTLETVVPLGARLGHPIWRRALREAGIEGPVAEDVIKRIAGSYVDWQENSFPGLLGNVVAGRIANRLDLGGTNCVVDAACASSLSAAHLASLELISGRADMVVTGGVDTFNDIFMYMCFSKTPALSPTGDSKPFDASGDGTILGEGLGMVVLKRLADAERDADTVYAVLKGIGSSSDGRGKAIYAPSPEGQVKALSAAYALSGVSPETIQLVEAHGTGTKVGDAAEVRALTEVYRGARAEGTWCALGSVKSMVGHTKAAAGAAGLIKAALALRHKVLPPTLKVKEPLPELAPGATPFYVNTEKRPWMPAAGHPRRAAVSAFGFGGSNFHAVLEEHRPAKTEADWDGSVELAAFSAADPDALRRKLEGFSALSWDELRVKAMQSRREFDAAPCRLTAVLERGKPLPALSSLLEQNRGKSSWSTPDGVYFSSARPEGSMAALFPGQGAQYVGMGRDLACQFPGMHGTLAEADAAYGSALSDFIYPRPVFTSEAQTADETALRATDVAQPAIGAVSLGALRVLEGFGLKPAMTGGHSYGELTALCAAGRLAPADFRTLSALRGRLMAAGGGDKGTMLAALAPLSDIEAMLREEKLDVVLANKNAPAQAVLSGSTEGIRRAAEALTKRGIKHTALPVAAAFHSVLVADAAKPLRAALESIDLESGSVPVYANTTGASYPSEASAAKDILAGQLAAPVEFVAEVTAMYRDGARVFLEIGPGSRLTGLVKSILAGKPHEALALDSSGGRRGGVLDLARVLAQLASLGAAVDLKPWEGGEAGVKQLIERKKPKVSVSLSGATPMPPARPAAPPVAPRAAAPTPVLSPAFAPVQAPALSEALRLSQEGIAALQKLQEQASTLHLQYLSGQETAQRALVGLIEQQNRLLGGATMESAFPAPVALAVQPPVIAAAAPVPAPAPVPAAEPVAPVLLAVVSEKTGYPAETLNLDMGLESDLGIDSIKRVEILAAMREKLPNAPVVGPQHVGTLRTLRQIIDFLSQGAPAAAASSPTAKPVAKPASNVEPVLLAVVSAKTGYPAETLNLDMGLESDLGIDSIKRVEILAAMREKLPDAPVVGPQHVGTLRTLRQIIDFLSQGGGAPAHAAKEPSTVVKAVTAEPAAPEAVIDRQALFAVPYADASRAAVALPPGALVWVTDDASPASQAVAERLRARGLRAEVVAPKPASDVPAGLAGLVVMAPEGKVDGRGLWSAASEAWLKDVFQLVRSAGPALKRHKTSLLVTVSRLDGAFGLGGLDGADPVAGGLAGLAKSARLEWPEVSCRALDAARQWPAAADLIAEETLLTGPMELGLSPRGRLALETRPAPALASRLPLSEGDLVVVTGGARGVTVEAALALASACRLTLELWGRSPRPEPEPAWLKGLESETDLKKAVLAQAGGRLAPKAIEEAYRRHAANREVLRSLARLEAVGARATYRCVDLRDEKAVAAAMAEARRAHGPVRALVHGAGTLADRRIEDKTPELFDAVFDTKVAGLRAMLAAVDLPELRAVVLFSSVSGRFGRVGQSDYAMANEVLNKAAQSLSRRLPAARVVAINWGPWEGGMVTPALKKVFASEGVALLPLGGGGRHLLSELAAAPGSDVETVVTAAAAQKAGPAATAFTRTIDVDSHPFLDSHVIDGKPVLPVAMMVEWLAHGALHGNPGLGFCGLDDLRVFKGVILRDGPKTIRVDAAKAVRDGSTFRVAVELLGEGGVPHSRATVLLSARPLTAPAAAAPVTLTPYARSAAEAYRQVLFHGTDFHGITAIEGCSPDAIAVRVRPAPAPSAWIRQPLRSAWVAEPLALDAAFQAMILWSVERRGAGCLPSAIARYRQYRDFPQGGVRAVVRVTRQNDASASADVDFLDASGALVARLEGSEHTIDASLNAAFRKTLAA